MVDSSHGEQHVPAPLDHEVTRIGRYTILERIGTGGMGEVFAAYDDKLDRKIAIKLLHPSQRLSSTSQARLLREAQALAKLSHPNVVTVFEAGLHGDRVFIAMEFIRGQTFGHWLRQGSRTWGEILGAFVAAGEGLVAMHEDGLVHRDFKPDNVLIDARGRPRLIDFGLVLALESGTAAADDQDNREDDDSARAALRSNSLTRTGAMLGTPMYMSPEQFERVSVTPASDQFSLCVALFEALYGAPPFEGDTTATRARAVLSGSLLPPPDDVELPTELLAVLHRGLRREPAARWPDMNALLSALRGLQAGYDPDLEDPEALSARRRLLGVLFTVVVMVLATFGAITSFGRVDFSAGSIAVMDAVMLIVVGGAMIVLRARWSGSRHRRRMMAFLLLLLTTFFLQDLTGYLSGRTLYHSILANAVSMTVLCFFAAPLTAHVMRWGALWSAACTVMMLVDPERYYLYFNAATFGTTIVVALVLPRRAIDPWIRTAASRGSVLSTGQPTGSEAKASRAHGEHRVSTE